MGQYWRLVNIDRWAVLGETKWGLKVPEVVEDASSEQLVGMLQRRRWVEFKPSPERLAASKGARLAEFTPGFNKTDMS